MKLTDEERRMLETRRVRGPASDENLAHDLERRGFLLAGSASFVMKRTYETTPLGLEMLANKD